MKTLYILACCLLAWAIVLDLAGKNQWSFATLRRARSQTAQQPERERIQDECKAALSIGNRFAMGGMVAAAGGMLFWFASAVVGRDQERRLVAALPLGLLAAYILLLFVWV